MGLLIIFHLVILFKMVKFVQIFMPSQNDIIFQKDEVQSFIFEPVEEEDVALFHFKSSDTISLVAFSLGDQFFVTSEQTRIIPDNENITITNFHGENVSMSYEYSELNFVTSEKKMFSLKTRRTYFKYNDLNLANFVISIKYSGGGHPKNNAFDVATYNTLEDGVPINTLTFTFDELEKKLGFSHYGPFDDLVFVITTEMEDLINHPLVCEIYILKDSGNDSGGDTIVGTVFLIIGIVAAVLCLIISLILFLIFAPRIARKFGGKSPKFKEEKEMQSESETDSGSGSEEEKSSEDELKTVLPPPEEASYKKRRLLIPKEETCSICLDYRIVVTFIPCSHVCCCERCANALMTDNALCPICRAEIHKLFLMTKRIELDKKLFPKKLASDSSDEEQIPKGKVGFTPFKIESKKKKVDDKDSEN